MLRNEQDSSDLLINFSASFSGPGLGERGTNHALLQHSQGWELSFNKAILLTDMGHYSEALSLLIDTKNTVSNDPALVDEFWIISAQIGYINQLSEETDTAIKIYEEILLKSSDNNLKAMIKNNLIAAKEQDTKEALRELKDSLRDDNKLTAMQKVGILLNYALIAFKKRKVQEAQQAIDEAEKTSLNLRRTGVVQAYILLKEKKNDEYKQYLLQKHEPWAYLLLIKILIQQNKQGEAANISLKLKSEHENLVDADYYITLAHILEETADLQQAVSILEEGLNKFADKKICEALGNLLVKSGQTEKAIDVYQLFLTKKEEKTVLANLVITAANWQIEIAEQWSTKLPKINLKALYSSGNAVESLDDIMDRLEFANLNTKQKVEEKKITEIVKKKRKRKPRYPKGFDPNNPKNPAPDPERWLPKKERSEYKKKMWKKQKKMKGPQGVVPDVIGQEVGSFAKGPSTAHIEAVGEKKRR